MYSASQTRPPGPSHRQAPHGDDDDQGHLVIILEPSAPERAENSGTFWRQKADLTLWGLSNGEAGPAAQGPQGGAGRNGPAKV